MPLGEELANVLLLACCYQVRIVEAQRLLTGDAPLRARKAVVRALLLAVRRGSCPSPSLRKTIFRLSSQLSHDDTVLKRTLEEASSEKRYQYQYPVRASLVYAYHYGKVQSLG